MASFRFCETYLLNIKLFVNSKSAIGLYGLIIRPRMANRTLAVHERVIADF